MKSRKNCRFMLVSKYADEYIYGYFMVESSVSEYGCSDFFKLLF